MTDEEVVYTISSIVMLIIGIAMGIIIEVHHATAQIQQQESIQEKCRKGNQSGQAPQTSPSNRVQHAAPRLQV